MILVMSITSLFLVFLFSWESGGFSFLSSVFIPLSAWLAINLVLAALGDSVQKQQEAERELKEKEERRARLRGELPDKK